MIIKGIKIIQNKNFFDNRGHFKELLKEKKIKKKFPFIVVSQSKQNVLRGLHIQTKNSQGKYISVIKGKYLMYVLILEKILKPMENISPVF